MKNNIKLFSLYLTGTLFWLIIISVLQARCVVNIPYFIDGLWSKDINESFVENLTGSIAYRTKGMGCEDKYIYIVNYHPHGMDGSYEQKTLTELADVKSWKKIASDNISTTYEDNNYRYILYNTSDGVYMRAFNK